MNTDDVVEHWNQVQHALEISVYGDYWYWSEESIYTFNLIHSLFLKKTQHFHGSHINVISVECLWYKC